MCHIQFALKYSEMTTQPLLAPLSVSSQTASIEQKERMCIWHMFHNIKAYHSTRNFLNLRDRRYCTDCTDRLCLCGTVTFMFSRITKWSNTAKVLSKYLQLPSMPNLYPG